MQVITCLIIALIELFIIYVNARSIVKPILNITYMLKEIVQGEGDLTKRLKTSGNDELSTLTNWFNQFLDQLQNLVGSIANTTHGLDASTGENFNVANETQAQISQQLREIDQAVTAVHEMVVTSQEIVKNTSDTADRAKSADVTAKQGLKDVHDTTEHINSLANGLDSTVEVINTLTQNSTSISSVITSAKCSYRVRSSR